MKTILRLLFILLILTGTLASCKKEEKTIKIDGSSTVYPITEAVAEDFRNEMKDVRVTIGISGTGGGFQKFGRGETDISDASRRIKEKEDAVCKENNISYVELKVAFDGLAVIVHPDNTWVDHFTVEELRKIWEPAAEGKITRWNQIRSEWPDEKFVLFGPGVASGTFDYFTEAIVGESGASRGDFTASEDDNVLVQGVASSQYGLGFFGLAYYEYNRDKLRLVPVVNDRGVAIEPSLETVSNESYNPLSRPLFIYVNSKAAKREEVKRFVTFYLENAPRLSKDVGYVPLPDWEYENQKEAFDKFLQDL